MAPGEKTLKQVFESASQTRHSYTGRRFPSVAINLHSCPRRHATDESPARPLIFSFYFFCLLLLPLLLKSRLDRSTEMFPLDPRCPNSGAVWQPLTGQEQEALSPKPSTTAPTVITSLLSPPYYTLSKLETSQRPTFILTCGASSSAESTLNHLFITVRRPRKKRMRGTAQRGHVSSALLMESSLR